MNTEEKLIAAMGGIVSIQQALFGMGQQETIGQRILKSASLQDFKAQTSYMVTVPLSQREIKSAILSSGGANDPLGMSFKPAPDPGTRRRLTLRDLIPEFPTLNAAIEMGIKTSATNNAAVQAGGSPHTRDSRALGESAYGFTNSFVPVETLGHWIPVSSQILEDSGTLDAMINTELLYGLALAVESQLLNGSGNSGQLDGLLANATAYTVASPNRTSEIDILRDAARQIQLADFNPTAIVLNPQDWFDIEIRKAGSGDVTYAAGAPRLMDASKLWSLPVVCSNSIASGTFLVGDFDRAAVLFNRDQATVELSRHDASNFIKGMLTLKAMERLALVITNPLGLVKGVI